MQNLFFCGHTGFKVKKDDQFATVKFTVSIQHLCSF